ncbi:PorV/PorQ family protein [bacterium]|nr:PorV/PorQ family protein [Candidatus Omnitrophota bacterium]MBU2529143.1 PorV/PorQ family protein [bacterium]MBU3930587.1 PorV/PorQ family protein [bacterium]MBU4123053.1 PorV/PorQ family protein [bacterium]
MITQKMAQGVKSLAALFCLSSASLMFAADAGKTSAQYLKIALNPRNEAMGGAGVAFMSDEIFYNPASIAKIEDSSTRAGYVSWFEDMSKTNIFTAMPIGNGNVKMAANLSYFNISGLTSYDGSGNAMGDFKRNSTDLSLAVAARAGRMSLGAAIKGINEKYAAESSKAFAADAGVILDITRKISLGASVVNKGTKIEIGTVEKELTSSARAGICIKPSDIVSINCDAEMPNDDDTRQHFGAEWEFNENYFLRGGWQKFGEIGGVTAGFGMKVNTSAWESGVTAMRSTHERLLLIDYSYQANSEFDNIHRFSIGMGF